MSVSGRETFSNVRGALQVVWDWSGDLPGCPRVIGRPSWMSGSGGETLPNVRVRSGGPPGCLWWSGGPHRCPGVVGSLSGLSGSGRESLPDVREWSGISA